MDEILILAWLREWRRMKSVFRLDTETTSAEVTRTRSLPQGDPAAPMLFNLMLDTLATSFADFAVRRKWGKQLLDGTWVNIILFADNYWLVATDPEMLRAMTEKWLDLLAEYGWETPVADLTWCSTSTDKEKGAIPDQRKENVADGGHGGLQGLGYHADFR